MYLPLTSIQDAWGVSTLEDRSDTAILTNRYENPPKNNSGFQRDIQRDNQRDNPRDNNGFLEQQQTNITHPNTIQEPIQGRMDIPVFDRSIIETMKKKPQQDRTHLITKLLRAYFTNPPETKVVKNIPTNPKPSVEYYKSSPGVNNVDAETLLSIMTLMLIFILADKLFVIWNKS